MKQLIAFVICLFYKHYKKGGTKHVAYESAIMAISFVIFLNISTIIILLDLEHSIFSLIRNDNGFIMLFKASLVFIPMFLILGFFFKKAYIKGLQFEDEKIRRGNVRLTIYVVVSFFVNVLLVVVKSV